MKRNIFYIYYYWHSVTPWKHEPAWGTPDTLEHYSLGAGVQYTKIAYRDKTYTNVGHNYRSDESLYED